MSEHESAAMWRLYGEVGKGLAVRSTIARFMNSFPGGIATGSGRDEHGNAIALSVHFAAVRYIDYYKDRLGLGLTMQPFFHKRKSFEHEREFRAVIQDLPIVDNAVNFDKSVFPDGGVAVLVDLSKMIEAVYVSPKAEGWFRRVVETMVTRSCGQCPVVQSRLDEDPIF